ncbi:membrane protein [gut metagenome]|uniref:Membrane protein n=1 Tax=gut metagenome TaxID=749906 RepID=J9GIS3_9ZZZZ
MNIICFFIILAIVLGVAGRQSAQPSAGALPYFLLTVLLNICLSF